MTAFDLYALLDVEPDANFVEIKKAYRKLCKKYHPDSGEDSISPTMFKLIQNAFDVLSNPEKRKAYDKRYKHIR